MEQIYLPVETNIGGQNESNLAVSDDTAIQLQFDTAENPHT